MILPSRNTMISSACCTVGLSLVVCSHCRAYARCCVFAQDEWKADEGKASLCRGRLLWAFVPFVEQEPRTLTPEGRAEPAREVRPETDTAARGVSETFVRSNRLGDPRGETAAPQDLVHDLKRVDIG